MDWLIPTAYAAGGGEAASGGAPGGVELIMLIVMMVVFYFFLIRPQQKRAKEHKNLVNNLDKGDEVVTSGGMLGKITKVAEEFVVIEISNNLEIKVQKQSIQATLPKGTIKSI